MLPTPVTDDGAPLRVPIDFFQHRIGLNQCAVAVVVQCVRLLERTDMCVPIAQR